MDIRSYIEEKKTLLFDGAMGTLYASLPGCAEKRCEQANLDEPDVISGLHRSYLQAGCRAIKTNTYSLGEDFSMPVSQHGEEMIRAACHIANEAAKPFGALVFADLGPSPQGAAASPAENFIARGRVFLENGLACFLLETLPTDEGVSEFARWLKEKAPDSFLAVSFAVGPDGYTHDGLLGAELYRACCDNEHIDAVGFNCLMGPNHMLKYVKELQRKDKPLLVMPNSGYPTVLGRRSVYSGTPEYFGEFVSRIALEGAEIVGGCCGTKPEHIRSLGRLLAERKQPEAIAQSRVSVTVQHEKGRGALMDKLSRGERIVAVEYDPPANDQLSAYINGVKKLCAAGADAITIADCPVGVPRIDSSLLACKLKRELGIEVIPHMACRDRNLNAAKALLMGLSAENVHNVLLITGDPMPSETRAEVKSVFNTNSRKLAKYVSSLGESSLSQPFNMFGALNLNVRNFDVQLSIAKEKEENGISCFLTQPVHSSEAFENLKRARAELKSKILGGIYPVVSYRNAVFMNNEIAGIKVCDEISELYKGLDREAAEELAYKISIKIAEAIEAYTDGLYIMLPFNRIELVQRILKTLKV